MTMTTSEALKLAIIALEFSERMGIYSERALIEACKQAIANEAPVLTDGYKLDAERYRWIRHGDNDDHIIQYSGVKRPNIWIPRNERLDAMIDDAIEAAPLPNEGKE